MSSSWQVKRKACVFMESVHWSIRHPRRGQFLALLYPITVMVPRKVSVVPTPTLTVSLIALDSKIPLNGPFY